jgi:hypothetical protein
MQKKSLTPHTYIQGTTHLMALCKVDIITRLLPRIFFIINELMSHVGIIWLTMLGPCHIVMNFSESKILIMSGFMSYDNSLMGPIKT